MGKSTTAQITDKDRQMTLSAHESDSPLLPMAQIERLHAICPEKVPWVFEETTKEGEFRRRETIRVNTLVFTERTLGVVAGLTIGLVALYVSFRLGMAGREAVACVIGGTTVVGLVSAFLFGVRRKPPTK